MVYKSYEVKYTIMARTPSGPMSPDGFDGNGGSYKKLPDAVSAYFKCIEYKKIHNIDWPIWIEKETVSVVRQKVDPAYYESVEGE